MSEVICFETAKMKRPARRMTPHPGERRGRLIRFNRPLRPEELVLLNLKTRGRSDAHPPINPEVLGGFGW